MNLTSEQKEVVIVGAAVGGAVVTGIGVSHFVKRGRRKHDEKMFAEYIKHVEETSKAVLGEAYSSFDDLIFGVAFVQYANHPEFNTDLYSMLRSLKPAKASSWNGVVKLFWDQGLDKFKEALRICINCSPETVGQYVNTWKENKKAEQARSEASAARINAVRIAQIEADSRKYAADQERAKYRDIMHGAARVAQTVAEVKKPIVNEKETPVAK